MSDRRNRGFVTSNPALDASIFAPHLGQVAKGLRIEMEEGLELFRCQIFVLLQLELPQTQASNGGLIAEWTGLLAWWQINCAET